MHMSKRDWASFKMFVSKRFNVFETNTGSPYECKQNLFNFPFCFQWGKTTIRGENFVYSCKAFNEIYLTALDNKTPTPLKTYDKSLHHLHPDSLAHDHRPRLCWCMFRHDSGTPGQYTCWQLGQKRINWSPLYSATFCSWADSLFFIVVYERLWMSDCSFTMAHLNIHQSGVLSALIAHLHISLLS